MQSLQRDPAEIADFVQALDPNKDGRITFDEFLSMMQQVENKIVSNEIQQDQQQQQQL